MITVRFPTGFSVQYNDLDHADLRENGLYLSKKSEGPSTYRVWAPLGCIVEHTSPCRTYFAANPNDTALNEARELRHKLELAQRQIRKLKGSK